jgi:hypothetical protein
VQAHHSGYYGNILTETGLSLSGSRHYLTPFSQLPAGNVLVSSSFADGTNSVQDVAFGGATTDAHATTVAAYAFESFLEWFKAPRVFPDRIKAFRKALSDAKVGVATLLPMYRWASNDDEERKAAVRHLLLESLERIVEASCEDLNVSPHSHYRCNVALIR